MEQVSEHREIAASPAAAWSVVGDFARAAEWCTGIVSLRADGGSPGAIRIVEIGAAEPIVERLERLDPIGRRLIYSILSGPLPVRDCMTEIGVETLSPQRCLVTYSMRYKAADLIPEKCERLFSRAFALSLVRLEQTLASPQTQTPPGQIRS